MNKINLYIYVAVLFAVVIIMSITVWVLKRRQAAPLPPPVPTEAPAPTRYQVIPTKRPVVTPSPIPPTQTGVFEEELPKEQQDLSTQKQNLKSKVPISNPDFTISFDYGEDKFVVELTEPKSQSETRFKEWLSANYPAIPVDRFILK